MGWFQTCKVLTRSNPFHAEARQIAHLATGTFYNNAHEADIVGPDANLKDSIHHWSVHGGLVGRGILLDYRAYADKKGIQYDSFIDHRIPYEELYLCGKDQGIDIRPEAQGGHVKIGDILFIRSGFVNQYHQTKSEDWKPIAVRPHDIGENDQQKWAGVAQEEKMLDWLHDCYFAAVAGDSPSFEAWPSNRGERLWPCPKTMCAHYGQNTTFMNTFLPCGVAPLGRCWISRSSLGSATKRKDGHSS